MHKIWVINGPNLNLIGERGPLYGEETYTSLMAKLISTASNRNVTVEHFQSNHEGEIIDLIHKAQETTDAIMINPGGYSHTSVSIRDALEYYNKIKIEVHITNIHAREIFRQQSLMSPVVNAVIAGFGQNGYILALDHIITMLKARK